MEEVGHMKETIPEWWQTERLIEKISPDADRTAR
jgi:hypothetical protein